MSAVLGPIAPLPINFFHKVEPVSSPLSPFMKEIQKKLPLPVAENRQVEVLAMQQKMTDWQMFFAFFQAVMDVMEGRKTSAKILIEDMGLRHEQAKKAMNEFMEVWKKSETTTKISDGLDVVSKGSALLLLAAIAGGYLSGGAIAAFKILQAAASFTGGTAALAKAITDAYKQNQDGTAFVLRQEHTAHLDEIKDLSKKTQESYEAVENLIGLMFNALSLRRQTARIITH